MVASRDQRKTTADSAVGLVDPMADDTSDPFARGAMTVEIAPTARLKQGHAYGSVAANTKIAQRAMQQLVLCVLKGIEYRTKLRVGVR